MLCCCAKAETALDGSIDVIKPGPLKNEADDVKVTFNLPEIDPVGTSAQRKDPVHDQAPEATPQSLRQEEALATPRTIDASATAPPVNLEVKENPKQEAVAGSGAGGLDDDLSNLKLALRRSEAAKMSHELNIPLVNKGEGLGLTLDFKDGKSLLITAVKPGIVQEWNTANPAQSVNTGDKIVAVNGICGKSTHLIEQMKLAGKLDVVILQSKSGQTTSQDVPSTFEVSLSCSSGTKLGIVADWKDGRLLHIDSVGLGKVAEYNTANAQTRVMAGDDIISVNNVSGDSQKMIEELKRVCT